MTNSKWYEKLDKIHPYPAKFPITTAERFILEYSDEFDTVLDPFVGSGTTVLASSSCNRYGVGLDINGIAIMISKFKLLQLTREDLIELEKFIENIKNDAHNENYGPLVEYNSINHWFCDEAIIGLSCIKNNIVSFFNNNERLLLFSRLTLSSIINTVSNQESDTRYAAVIKEGITVDYVIELYEKKLHVFSEILLNCKRNEEVLANSNVFLHNSKNCDEVIKKNSVDLIVTSPPYPNTYDYYLYHKHRMLWLDEDFQLARDEEIGSRREFSSLKHSQDNFDQDLFKIFSSCNIVLKNNAKIVIIIGDGKIQGEKYDSYEHTKKICEEIGWELLDYSYTNLDKTSKSFQKSFRTLGKKEHIMVFEKVNGNEN